jgi:hypothetical protein
MIGSWSNRIIDESRCQIEDRHALDASNPDVNYVALGLAEALPLGNTSTTNLHMRRVVNPGLR